MADRYLKATGNWADNNTWSATDGGAAGATFPITGDNVYITANGNGLTLTIAATAYCANFICSGATTVTLAGGSDFVMTGNCTLLSSMTMTYNGSLSFRPVSSTSLLTTNGLTLPCYINVDTATGILQLQDTLTLAYSLGTALGTINTNGKTVSCNRVLISDTGNIILGASTITLTGSYWSFSGTGSVTANTSTIIVSAAQNFTGGGQIYNIVNLNGATHTIADSSTFAQLGLTRAGVQTITFTDGTTQTVTNLVRDSGVAVKTLAGSSTAGWAITKSGSGYVRADYVSVSRSTGSPTNAFRGTINSTNGGNNSGWLFITKAKLSALIASGLI